MQQIAFCQSGRKLAGAVLLTGAAIPALCGAQAVSWAHQNGSLQSNGSITIKSQSGGSYAGQVNPAGAVAKANQSAVTQPPTVIIQATSGGYGEAIPLVVSGTATIPTCPAGYTSQFTASSSTYTGRSIFNIAGTRYSFSGFYNGSSNWYGFLVDSLPSGTNGWNASSAQIYGNLAASNAGQWAANLCTK